MQKILLIACLVFGVSACSKIAPVPASSFATQPLAAAGGGGLSAVQVVGVCDAFSDVVISSISNIIQNKAMPETKAYTERVASDLFRGFPELAEDQRILITRFLQSTVTSQYTATPDQILRQVKTFKDYGVHKFRAGTAQLCVEQIRTGGMFASRQDKFSGVGVSVLPDSDH